MTQALKFEKSQTAEAAAPILLRDGAKIQTWVHPGNGTPLVFLHGLGSSTSHWKYQLAHAQSMKRLTIHLDYRGHGISTLGDALRPLTITTLSHDLREVLDQLSIETSVILGQSMGGTIALQFAHDHPNRCAGLVIQGAAGRNPYATMSIGDSGRAAIKMMIGLNKISPKWARMMNKAASHAPLVMRELIRRNRFNPALARNEEIENYIQHFFATNPNLFYELAEDLQDFDISKMDHLINVPALIIAGALDKMVPLDECKWLAKRLPQAELEIIAHGSHCPQMDDPAYVNQRIHRFLETYHF